MATLTIRRLDEGVKKRLRLRAAERGTSLEEEARRVLSESVRAPIADKGGLASAIAAIVDPIGGIEIEIPQRGSHRGFVDFSEDDQGDERT